MTTTIANTASKIIKKSQGLRERYLAEMDKREGKEKYELAVEVARLTQEQAEQVSFAALVQKEVIEGWTDADYADMEVDRAVAQTELGFTTTILPLADIHTESERRKSKAKERLEASWGEGWEDLVGDLMPPWPAEEFLRSLAVFSENHAEWAAAEELLEKRIAERLAAKKTKKVPWLTSRDVTGKDIKKLKSAAGKQTSEEEGSGRVGPAGQVTNVETQTASQTAVETPVVPSSSSGETAARSDGVVEEDIVRVPPGSEEATEKQGSISHGSSATPSAIAEDLSGPEDASALEESVEETKEKEVGDGEEGEVNAAVSPITPRKRRRDAAKETEGKRRRYGVDIPVINLDVDEGVEELKREARGEEEKDDALAVEGAMRVLFGGERPGKEHATRLLGKIMKVLKAEVVEVEEEEE